MYQRVKRTSYLKFHFLKYIVLFDIFHLCPGQADWSGRKSLTSLACRNFLDIIHGKCYRYAYAVIFHRSY